MISISSFPIESNDATIDFDTAADQWILNRKKNRVRSCRCVCCLSTSEQPVVNLFVCYFFHLSLLCFHFTYSQHNDCDCNDCYGATVMTDTWIQQLLISNIIHQTSSRTILRANLVWWSPRYNWVSDNILDVERLPKYYFPGFWLRLRLCCSYVT